MSPAELAEIKARFFRGERISDTEILRLIWAAEEAASVPEVARLLKLGGEEFDERISLPATWAEIEQRQGQA